MTEFQHIAPWALLLSAVTLGVQWLLLRAFQSRPAWSLAMMVVVPLLSSLAFVVAISGFMFTPQLGWTLVTCALVAVMLVPTSAVLGQQFARRALAAEAGHARERAREESHRELVGWISHDLRTPLAGIKAMAEALEDRVVEVPDEVAQYGSLIARESTRLSSMVDDLFELSRIANGALPLRIEAIALDGLVQSAVTGLRPLAAERGVKIVTTVPPLSAMASGRELDRIVANLMANAVRHTPAGGSVVVAGGMSADRAILTVSDGCDGISEADLPRIFEVGYRGSTARSPERDSLAAGAGLGLAIVRGLLTAQDGEVAVSNVPGGCRFEVRLPVAKEVLPVPG